MEVFLTILLFVIVMIIAAVLFAGWMVVMVLRAGLNLVGALGRWMTGRSAGRGWAIRQRKPRLIPCANPQCRAGNPQAARFCRRCGQPLRKAVQVFAQRAAIL